MKFCQKHWDMLRDNIKKEGIYDWVAQSGEVAAAQLKDQIARKESTKVNYDPLMSCHNMMMERAIEMAGLAVMTEEFGCPICVFNNFRTEDGRCPCQNPECRGKEPGSIPNFETWLEETPKACKEYMIEEGWISG